MALKQIAVLAGGILLACIVYVGAETMSDVRWLLGAYITVAIGISVTAVGSGAQFTDQFGGSVVSGRLSGAFSHPNQLGLFSAIAACLGIGLAFGSRTSRGRVIAATASAVCLFPLVLSLSRGAWIGCGLAFLYLLLALREARRALLVAVCTPRDRGCAGRLVHTVYTRDHHHR